MRSQSSKGKFLASAITTMALCLIIGTRFVGRAESTTSHNGISAKAGDTTQGKIARAMSAGPDDISESARIVDKDAQGKTVVLREGSNGFTCMPGNPNVVGDPPMCADAHRCSGQPTSALIDPSQRTASRASLTCLPAPRSEAILILMTPQALPYL